MLRKVAFGVLVALVIVTAVFNPLVLGVLALVVWIYLFIIVRKQRKGETDDQKEPVIPEPSIHKMKLFLVAAALLFLAFIVSAVLHNVLHGPAGEEETIFFMIALAMLLAFIVATAGGLVTLVKARRSVAQDSDGISGS